MEHWETYEQVAAYILNQFAAEFELERVEGKQNILGKSGASWEIDAKGVRRRDRVKAKSDLWLGQ